MKTCIKCGEPKPLDRYHKKRSNTDGYDNRCKDCMADYYRRRARHESDEVLPYEDRPSIPNITGKPWEIVSAPCDEFGDSLWTPHGRLSNIDVSRTLNMGYFDEGMVLWNRQSGGKYTVENRGDRQILKNGRFYLVSCNSYLKKVRG